MDSHIRDVSETQPYASRGSFAIIEQPTGPRPTANPLPRRPVHTVIDERERTIAVLIARLVDGKMAKPAFRIVPPAASGY